MLRAQLIISLCLVGLVFPIWWLDDHSLKSNGRDWIALDIRGLFVRSYVAFLIVHILLSTVALYVFRGTSMWSIQLCSGVCAIALLGAGIFVYDRVQRSRSRSASHELQEQRKAHLHDIELKSWWYVPNEADPKEIHVELMVAAPGRFSGSANGFDGQQQRTVNAEGAFTYVFLRNGTGPVPNAGQLEFTFYLFRGPVGSSTPNDISKVFLHTPKMDDDGSYFYGTLPVNSQGVQ